MCVCSRDLHMCARCQICTGTFSRPFGLPANAREQNADGERTAKNGRRVANHPRGIPREKEKKITGAARPAAKITTAMTPSARSLKISLFFFYSLLLPFRVSFNRRKCEAYKNGVPRHTRHTRVLPSRVSLLSVAFPFPVFFPSFARSLLRSLFHREREINGVDECRGGGCVEGPAYLILFHLLSLA